ncbi:MAG: Crp/Fnr family transcriptional regulator [Bacteroidota bacterium]|nr:Crp/Fnr family transcriptional regulator [Bacteroidota bacterium]
MVEKESKYWYIKGGQLFTQLDDEDYKELDWISCMVHCNKSEFVYLPQEQHRKVYYLKQGLVKLGYYDENGNEIILDILKPGDLFGEVTFDVSKSTTEFAQALMNDTKLCNFNISELEKVLIRKPTLALRISKKIGEQQTSISQRLSKIIYKDARSRIIDFFKDWVIDEKITDKKNIELNNYLTHAEIGGLNGLARQTVTSILNELKESELLFLDRRKIIIPDLNKLK